MYNISLDWSIWGWVILLQGSMDQQKRFTVYESSITREDS